MGARALLVLAAVTYAAFAARTRPLTGGAAVAVAVPAAVVLLLAARRPPRSPAAAPGAPDPGLRRTALAWGALLGLAAAVELAALVRQPAYDVASTEHPTVSVLLDPLTGGGPARFVAWCGWLGLGWVVLRR